MRFMIQTSGKQDRTKEDFAAMLAALPAQGASDAKRIKQGLQEGPAIVAADRSKAWRIYNVESEEQMLGLLKAEPLSKFSDFEITPLLNEEDNVPG